MKGTPAQPHRDLQVFRPLGASQGGHGAWNPWLSCCMSASPTPPPAARPAMRRLLDPIMNGILISCK